MARREGAAAAAVIAAIVTGGCAARRATSTASAAPATIRSDGAERVCLEQADEVGDAMQRLADPHLWEEVEKLVQLHALARHAPDGAPACAEATRAALVAVARRWASAGIETGGARMFDLARRAYRALATDFPAATAELQYTFGRLEWTRATRIVGELGEPTLAADRYLAAHQHHTAALRGGLLTPEEARLSATTQVEALRRALDYQDVKWDEARSVCAPDERTGECPAGWQAPVLGAMSEADRQMLAAYSVYLAEPATKGLAEARMVALARAELLLRGGRAAEAEADLRAAMAEGDPTGARAGLLWLRSLQARWLDRGAPTRERVAARRGLIAATAELQRHKVWSAAAPTGDELRAALPRLRAAALRVDADEARADRDFTRCTREFELLADETDRAGAAEPRFAAARCAEQGGAYVKAIEGYTSWLATYAGHALAPDVEVRLGKTHERVLNVEAARDAYIRFLALAPDDLRAGEVRRWSIALALVTGTLEDAQVDQLARAGERNLAAILRFRTEVRPGSPLARIQGYIHRFGKDGGGARLAIAHVRAAAALMRSSCPVHALGGLCVEVSRERTLGRVVARDRQQLAQARVHLDEASALLSADLSAREAVGPPLAIEPGEVATARRILSLLRGDLGAEAALSTRPPASLDPQRSREWFVRRTNEVARMKVVYESVNPGAGREVALMDAAESTASDRFAAVLEARKAQVYEADVGLLEEVAAAVAAKSAAGSDGAALATSMRAQADERRAQVFTAYHRCIDLVAAWGHDPDGQAEMCRAGLGRLVQRYEGRLEYVPPIGA